MPRPHLASGVELFTSAMTVPYAAGMRQERVPLAGGKVTVPGPRREPVVLARLKRPLADEAVVVRARVEGTALPQVLFAPFSAEGTLLPLFRPELPAGSDGTGDISLDVAVHRVRGEQRLQLVPSAAGAALGQVDAAGLVEAVVLEGRFARLLYAGTLGSQRAIRAAREIQAARHLDLAHSRGLDDLGRSLGVPRRLADTPEPDARYRSRMAVYSSWRMPTPAGLAEALNGRGAEGDKNAGLPAAFGIEHRFRLVEQTNDLAIATKLVAVGGAQAAAELAAFHAALRGAILVDLERVTPPLVPAARRTRLEAVRTTIRSQTTRPSGASRPRHLAPLAAITLDRATRLMRALGMDDEIFLNRAYDPAGGSRYELGLGVDLGELEAAQLEQMADRVDDLAADGAQPELAALAQSLTPRPLVDDPLGRWLLEPCGFRTVHQLSGGAVHLSPLPTFGQVVEGPAELQLKEQGVYQARRLGEVGAASGIHVQAQRAVLGTADAFADAGLGSVPPVLTPAELASALEELAEAAASPGIPGQLDDAVAAGIVTADSKGLATQLRTTMNLDQVVAFAVAQADLAGLGTGQQLSEALVARLAALGDAGFYSSRGIWDGSRVLLLAAISQLPGASAKIGEPPPASFRWYTTRVPASSPGLADPVTLLQARGGRGVVRGVTRGVGLVVCVSYARQGLADPFEVRVELDDADALLDGEQYGFVMNLLDHLHPVGVEINTFDIRRRHVDLDGDGKPEFLTSGASRSYHQYRHRRPFGSGRGREQRGS